MTRAVFKPELTPPGTFYRLATGVLVPRPIAWVSTRSAAGVDNLAPYSFVTVVSVHPLVISVTSTPGSRDTRANAEAAGAFVVNLAPAPLLEQVNATSAGLPESTSEFATAGVEGEPADLVPCLRVAQSPAAFECELYDVVEVGDCALVMGRVLGIAIRRDVLAEDGLPDFALEAPLGRLGRNEWVLPGEVVRLDRPR